MLTTLGGHRDAHNAPGNEELPIEFLTCFGEITIGVDRAALNQRAAIAPKTKFLFSRFAGLNEELPDR